MKRFAVAFIYEDKPKYDRVTFDGNKYRYYQGNNLVEEYPKEMMNIPFKHLTSPCEQLN